VRLRAIVENVVKENQKQLSEKLTNDVPKVTPAAIDEQAAGSAAFSLPQTSSFGALRTLIYSVLPEFVSTPSTELWVFISFLSSFLLSQIRVESETGNRQVGFATSEGRANKINSSREKVDA
jgi:hypothetical protein